MNKNIKYFTGSFLIQANEAFLNGGASTFGEDQNIVMPKFMWVNGKQVPYVSSQAWKHWLRETLIEETGWPASNLRAIGWNKQGNTSKVGGMLNPIDYPEDDIFGYMYAYTESDLKIKDLNDEQKIIIETLPKLQLVRPAVFLASLLSAIQLKGTITKDEAFIHLKSEETPLPYTTGFYNADLNAIFGIDLNRLGIFNNYDASEVDPELIKKALNEKKIEIIDDPKPKKEKAFYRKNDLETYQNNCLKGLLNALVHLRGGAKLAQFGVDISPKVVICVGLTFNAPIFNNLFEIGNEKPLLRIELLKELIGDYKDRIKTPVFIGIRQNYLENEAEVRKLTNYANINIMVSTPVDLLQKVGEYL